MKVLKYLTMGAVLFIIMISNLQAGGTRIQTLGYEANFYVQDDNNIWYFPSTLPNHRSLVIAESEYPHGELWSGGVHVPITTELTLGVYLSNIHILLQMYYNICLYFHYLRFYSL